MADGQTSDLKAAVLASLRGQDIVELSRQAGVEAEVLVRLKAGFVDAGTAWLDQHVSRRAWIQINATLNSSEPRLGAALVSGRLQDEVRGWLADRTIEEFHFVFKPPGARVRFLGEHNALRPALSALFDALAAEGAIAAWSRGLYDVETYQFGGQAGLDAAHSFFTVESLAVLRFWRQAIAGNATISPADFSLTLLDLFFRRVIGDEWELWDLWNKMELTGRVLRLAGAARRRAIEDAWTHGRPLVESLRSDDPALAWLSEPERTCLLEYKAKLPPLGDHLRQLHEKGALLFPLREILPFWVIFHFNRMCFSAAQQRFLSFLMSTVLCPKATPIGA